MIIPADTRGPYEDYVRAFMEKFRMDRDEAERATRSAIGMGIFKPSDWTDEDYVGLDAYYAARVAAGK
ncbi:hypothetical protein [uncultured Gordonia sp.]|jgi:hypothetical protein|uniref:hypothetical protein n=1 Tax=uncultured Gordonia sp. TaxID=198437 RepID=UPI0026090CA1|nr:hypothetical protein [uncultured Gordonia sp.]